MNRLFIMFVAALLSAGLQITSAQQSAAQAEKLLAGAQHKATVDGDLKGAIEEYKKAVAAAGSNRAVASQALVRMAECYQKLGDAQARKIFEQVLREYADQREAAALARARLGAGNSPTLAKGDRAVWTGPRVRPGAVSSDGRLLAYNDDGNLAVHDLTTGADRTLTNGRYGPDGEFAELSAISRDGRRVAYAWFGDKKRYELRVVDTQGTGLPSFRRLLDMEDVNRIVPFDWSPDGRWIAVQLGRMDQSGQIALVGVSDGALRILKSVDWNGPVRIFFSPDGRYIAYDLASPDGGAERRIFVLAVDGSRETMAFADGNENRVVGWSPDGKHLVFVSTGTLWALPFDDGKPQGPRVLLREFPGAGALGIAASGALYTYKVFSDQDIRIGSIDWEAGKFATSPVNALPPPSRGGRFPDWSADGKFLSVATGGGPFPSTILIRSIETGEVRVVRPALRQFVWPRWSPDGRSFIVSGYDLKGRPGIYRIDAQSGATSSVIMGAADLSGPNGNALPIWSADGQSIYYRMGGSGKDLNVRERNLTSGNEREVFRGAAQISASPDGRYLAAPSGTSADGKNSSVVTLIPLAGGAPRELFRTGASEGIPSFWSIDWTPDSAAVLVLKETGERRELWQVPINGTPPRRLDIDANVWARINTSFRLHPDGRQIAFVAGQLSFEVWALENFLPAQPATRQSAKK